MAFEPFLQLLRGIQGKRTHDGFGGIQNSQQIAYLRHLQNEFKQQDLNVPLQDLEVVVFDIETTGFSPEKGDSILSIGAVKMCGTEIMEEGTFYSLIKYEEMISNEIQQLTGITNELVKDAPPLNEVIIEFFQFAKKHTLVAHHASHEKSFMQYYSSKYFRIPFKHRIVDTSFLYKIVEPNLKLVTLESLCQYNEIPIVKRHHALGDAMMTAKLWSIYVKKVQQIGCETLNDVYSRFASL